MHMTSIGYYAVECTVQKNTVFHLLASVHGARSGLPQLNSQVSATQYNCNSIKVVHVHNNVTR